MPTATTLGRSWLGTKFVRTHFFSWDGCRNATLNFAVAGITLNTVAQIGRVSGDSEGEEEPLLAPSPRLDDMKKLIAALLVLSVLVGALLVVVSTNAKAATSRMGGWADSVIWSEQFFFSSRRRHTRCSRDWSSDVCSSD